MEKIGYGMENLEERIISPKETQEYLDILEKNKVDKDTQKVSDLYRSQLSDLACKARGKFAKGRTMHFPKIQNQESAKIVFSALMKKDPYTPRIVLEDMAKNANPESEIKEEEQENVNDIVKNSRRRLSETLQGALARREAGERMLKEKIRSGEVIDI